MILWFAGASVVIVWAVFKSPALDYRLVMLGSVLPVGELVLGGPRLLHTLLLSVVVLFGVMLLTQRRRLLRRRLIGLPIGMLLHLVLDGVWARPAVFWWPFFGFDVGTGSLPELSRGPGTVLLLELVGLGCLVWAWRRFGLDDAGRRAEFFRYGRLDRRLAVGGTP
jgi:hypothetical protein